MTHRDHRHGFEFETQADCSPSGGFSQLLELLVEHGFEGMAQAMQTLLNEAMKLERRRGTRRAALRTGERRGDANGYQPKTVHTRVGDWELAVPQARGVEF
jgi:transposase-like protein